MCRNIVLRFASPQSYLLSYVHCFRKPVKAFWSGMLLGSAKFVTFWYPKSNRYAVPRGHLCDCSSVKFHSGNPDGRFLELAESLFCIFPFLNSTFPFYKEFC